MMVSEDRLSRLWPIMARREGHKPALPRAGSRRSASGRGRIDLVKVSALTAGGASAQEIAAAMEISLVWAYRLRKRALRDLKEGGVV